ncbi:putative integrase [Nitrospirillum viridazoti Y2]|nr:putative integrase [Nitrospirillum amazonense Y2]
MQRACRKRPVRLRVEGPLAPYQGAYAEYLADCGYSQVSYWKKTFLVSEFSRWLDSERIAASEITAEHEAAFLRDRAQCRILKGGDAISLSGMTGWLRDRGVVDDEAALPTGPSGAEEILQEYAGWLREERGLAPSTIENYGGYIRRFLTGIFGANEPELAGIRASQVTDYIRRNAPRGQTFAHAKNTVTSLRSFFRPPEKARRSRWQCLPFAQAEARHLPLSAAYDGDGPSPRRGGADRHRAVARARVHRDHLDLSRRRSGAERKDPRQDDPVRQQAGQVQARR